MKFLAQPLAEYGDGYDEDDWRQEKESAIGRALELSYQADEADPPIAVWSSEWDLVAMVFAGEEFVPRPTLGPARGDENPSQVAASLSHVLGCDVAHFAGYADGFSFTVPTELDAYKCAHRYQHCKEVRVRFAPAVDRWLVQVYRTVTNAATTN